MSKYTIDRLKKCPLSFSSAAMNDATHNNEIIHDDASHGGLTTDHIRPFIIEVEAMLNKALLGVDFIIDASDPMKVYCVDINLFPSYTGFEGVSRLMGELIRKKCVFSC